MQAFLPQREITGSRRRRPATTRAHPQAVPGAVPSTGFHTNPPGGVKIDRRPFLTALSRFYPGSGSDGRGPVIRRS